LECLVPKAIVPSSVAFDPLVDQCRPSTAGVTAGKFSEVFCKLHATDMELLHCTTYEATCLVFSLLLRGTVVPKEAMGIP
jgi:hypothetical protein